MTAKALQNSVSGDQPYRETRLPPWDEAVALAPFFWDSHDEPATGTPYCVARCLASHIPVLYVEPPLQWNPRSTDFSLRRLAARAFGRRVRSVRPQLSVFARRGVPFGRVEALRRAQVQSNAKALAKLLSRHGSRRTLLWHSFPYWSEPLVDTIKHDHLVYHCLDHSERPEEERRLVERADTVFCVSQALVEKHRAANRRTYLLPNGVDLDLFDPARASRSSRPLDIPSEGKVIGFVGRVDRHVDVALLVELARAFPRDHIVVIGDVARGASSPQGRQRVALDTLRSLIRAHVLGFRRPSDLPRYLLAFDVCLIPLLEDPFNAARDPLKFYQYMAMGKPVVSSPVTAALAHPNLCRVAETRGGFLDAVADALRSDGDVSERAARIALARTHSWPALIAHALAEAANSELPGRREDRGREATPIWQREEALSQRDHRPPARVSVIVATKNRADDLRQTVASVLKQTQPPAELIVVDQSEASDSANVTAGLFEAHSSDSGSCPKLVYVWDQGIAGLTMARNRGIELAHGQIWLFLDDDVELEPNFIHELQAAYDQDLDATGVSGIITNYCPPALSSRLWSALFVRGPFHDDRQGIYWRASSLVNAELIRVGRFTGACMSFRADRAKGVRFREVLAGPDGDDVDFCVQLGRDAKLVIAPRARLAHNRSPIGRARDHWIRPFTQANYSLYLRYWRHGVKNRVFFLWLNAGLALAATLSSIRHCDAHPWRALFHGARGGRRIAEDSGA